MTRSQLAPGVEVVTVPGQGLAVRTADGEFLRVNTGDVPPDALLDRLSGAGPGAESGQLDQLVEAFETAGYAERPGAAQRPSWPERLRDVWLLGEPDLTEPLARQLGAAGAVPRGAAPEELAVGEPAAVVWCLDRPVPEGLWDTADQLPRRGIAWARCHREGWQTWVEPLAAAPGDVTSAHIRARRLAATPAHQELAAYWSGARTTGVPVPYSSAAASLVAALLTADLTAWATDTDTGTGTEASLPARRRLRRVDLRTLTVTEHPVLPVPEVAPLPQATA